MSKSIRKVDQERQIFSILEPILKQQLDRQDEQGKALHTMFQSMQSMYSEFQDGMAEMKQMVQEVRDTVTLSNAECFGLQSAVHSKSYALAKDRFHEEEEAFTAVDGKYRRLIWRQLKKKFNVPKYNCIRHIDHPEALAFVAAFKPEDYI